MLYKTVSLRKLIARALQGHENEQPNQSTIIYTVNFGNGYLSITVLLIVLRPILKVEFDPNLRSQLTNNLFNIRLTTRDKQSQS